MKKILLLLLIIISINGLAQFPATQSQGTVNTKVVNNGGFQAIKGLINGVFADTTAANSDYIDFYNGAQIYTRSDRNFWLRDSVSNSWVRMAKFSDVGSDTHFGNTNLTQTANRTYAGAGFNYTLNNLGHWSFNMATGKEFYLNNSSLFYLNSTTNDWALLGKSGNAGGVYVIADDASNSLQEYAGISSTRNSNWQLYPDSISIRPGGNGKINIDSLRAGTADDYLMTWNPNGAVGKMPTVKYNISSPQEGDILVYDDDNNEWINTQPAVHTDSSFYLKEYPDVSYLDTSSYNAALIDGRLWVKYGSIWRRQAYDSTYTVSAPVGCSSLLDTYSGSAMALSLRAMNSAYSGDAIRVRRSSDNAEMDIGFVDCYLDTATLKTFVGANDGRIVTWYDQEGSNNATQSTAGNQPYIMTSGSLVYSSGFVTIDFGDENNPYHLLLPTGFLNGATSLSYFQVATITNFGSSNAGVFAPSNSNSVGLEVLQSGVSFFPTLLRINGTGRNANSAPAYYLWNDAAQSLTSIFGNATDVTAYNNSAAVSTTNSSAMPALNFNGVYAIGMYNSTATDMSGKIKELVIYTSNQVSNRAGIEGNINTFYSIY